MERVSALASGELAAGAATPGLLREVAFETDRAILVHVHADGGVSSGWHHHGDREVLGHVVKGRARFEFGPKGGDHTDVPEGGFFHIPAGLVHRDVNPFNDPQEMVISFVGTGPLVVDGPDPA